MPKFSVIVPAHNAEKTIKKSLQSVRSQTFTDYELIVICDACTDRTKSIAKKYADKLYEVDFHKSSLTRNVGLDNAEGDWILFLDADDWYLHEYVFELLANKVGKQIEDCLMFAIIWKHIGYGGIRSPKGTIYPHVANKCWRRYAVGDTRFREDVARGEDGYFLDDMMAKDIKIAEWDMPLYYYNYLAEDSKSVQFGRTAEHTKQYWSNH